MTNKNDKILAPVKGRVIQFIENQSIEKKMFFEKLGVASSNFRGNALYSEISADVVAKILTLHPNVNSDWLLTGKGSMLKEDAKTNINQTITGDSNIQSGNNTNVTGDCKEKVQELQKQLEEYKKQLREKENQVSQLINTVTALSQSKTTK